MDNGPLEEKHGRKEKNKAISCLGGQVQGPRGGWRVSDLPQEQRGNLRCWGRVRKTGVRWEESQLPRILGLLLS